MSNIEWLQDAPATMPRGSRLVKITESDPRGLIGGAPYDYAVITDPTVTLDDIIVQYRDDVWTEETPYTVRDLHAEWVSTGKSGLEEWLAKPYVERDHSKPLKLECSCERCGKTLPPTTPRNLSAHFKGVCARCEGVLP
jgi:hypothetical protein